MLEVDDRIEFAEFLIELTEDLTLLLFLRILGIAGRGVDSELLLVRRIMLLMRPRSEALLAFYAPDAPDHPMTAVLREGLAAAQAPKRRGGRRGRG